MKRVVTKALTYIDKCTCVCVDDLPTLEVGQLATCVVLINEYAAQKRELERSIEAQRSEILDIMRRLHRSAKSRSYVFYTAHPEWFGDVFEDCDAASSLPDGILFTVTHSHEQRRFDVTRFKSQYPQMYQAFVKTCKAGLRLLTGRETYERVKQASLPALPPSNRALFSPLSGTKPHLVASLKPTRSPQRERASLRSRAAQGELEMKDKRLKIHLKMKDER